MKNESQGTEKRESDYWGAFSRNLFVLSIILSIGSFWKWEFGIVAGVLMLGAIYSVKVSELALTYEKHDHECENGGACASLNKNIEEMMETIK